MISVQKIDDSRFQATLAERIATSRKAPQQVVREQAKIIVQDVIELTPPASEGTRGKQAEKQGRTAIDRDLSKVFVGVRIRGKRQERVPVPMEVYRPIRSAAQGGSISPRQKKYYVDKRKLKALAQRMYEGIGRLASGFVAAARELGSRVPPYVARHGRGPGSISIDTSNGMRIRVSNRFPAKARSEASAMIRRINFVLRRREGAMRRQLIEYFKRRAA